MLEASWAEKLFLEVKILMEHRFMLAELFTMEFTYLQKLYLQKTLVMSVSLQPYHTLQCLLTIKQFSKILSLQRS